MKEILLGIGLIACSLSHAQSVSPEVTATAGAHFAIPSIQMSWTLGEPITQSFSNSTAQFNQGFQQAFIDVTGIFDYDFAYTVEAFPNPTVSTVRIKLSENVVAGKMSIIDPTGKTIYTNDITESDFLLDFAPYAQGTYLLNLIDEAGTLLHTVRLEKIN
jgi:hypothetical protein